MEPYSPLIRNDLGRKEIFDPIRRRWVTLTPEEWVRQQTIYWLHKGLSYPHELIQVESALSLNGLTKRCDIVVFDKEVHPLIIVECKREGIPLNQKVIDQACRYNFQLHVPYLLLTNGIQQLALRVEYDTQSLTRVQLPEFESNES